MKKKINTKGKPLKLPKGPKRKKAKRKRAKPGYGY